MKKYFLGIMAAVIAITFSAFTLQSQNTHPLAGEKWFKFNGTDPGDLLDANSYSLDGNGSTPTVCSSTTDTYRCEIHAVPDSDDQSIPDLSTIQSEKKRPTAAP